MTEDERKQAVRDLIDACNALENAVPGSIEYGNAVLLASVALARLRPSRAGRVS